MLNTVKKISHVVFVSLKMGDLPPSNKIQSDDKNLGSLIEVVLSQPEGSFERKKAFNRLLWELSKQPGLLKSSHPDYGDALQQTFIWVARNIERFNYSPDADGSIDKQFIRWVNSYLKYRVSDLYTKKSRDYFVSTTSDVDILENIPDENTNYDNAIDYLNLVQYIEEDPDSILRSSFIRNRPDCNCQVITRSKIFQESTWDVISNELCVSIPTLSSFWTRKCLPLLRQIFVSNSEFEYSLKDRISITPKSDSEATNLSDLEKIHEVIKSLPEDKREIIELRLAGKKWDEIAKHFQAKGEKVLVPTVRKRGQRAMEELRKLLLMRFGSSEISI